MNRRLIPVLLLLASIGFNLSTSSQSPSLMWAKRFAGPGTPDSWSESRSVTLAMTTDTAGNIYTTGYFYGTVDFDPGSAVFNLSQGPGSFGPAFILKLSSVGDFIWAKKIDGSGSVMGYGIVVDDSGNIYTAGEYSGNTDFDPGPGISAIYGSSVNAFLLKLNSLGEFVWVKNLLTNGNGVAYSLAIGPDRNLFTTGYFRGTVDFDPGTGVYNLTAVAADVFVSKISTNGEFRWARKYGTGVDDAAYATTVDRHGNVYLTGYLDVTMHDAYYTYWVSNLAGGVPPTDAYAFVSKIDTSGSQLWEKKFIGSVDSSAVGVGIAVDSMGNVYSAGLFAGTFDMDPGAGVFQLKTPGSMAVYLSKLDSAGNFQWAKRYDTPMWYSMQTCRNIVISPQGYICTMGSFLDEIDLDPGPGKQVHRSEGNWDIYVSILDASGEYVWGKTFGSSGKFYSGGYCWDYGMAIAVDSKGNITTTGLFDDQVDFDPGPGEYNLVSTTRWCTNYLQKLYTGPAGPSVTVTHPDCLSRTGRINVGSAISGNSYSIDGISYTNTSGIFTGLTPGIYQVTAKNSIGVVSNPTYVTINNIPTFNLSLYGPPASVDPGGNVQFNTTGDKPYTVTSWQPAAHFPMQTAKSQNIKMMQPMTVTVTGISLDNCVDTAAIHVNVKEIGPVFIPSAFSPNGDGVNDVFLVYGNFIEEIQLSIFDQWGNRVFRTKDKTEGWDGRYQGKMLPSGVYVYVVKAMLVNGEVVARSGSLNLIR